jgi:hypothetical protein
MRRITTLAIAGTIAFAAPAGAQDKVFEGPVPRADCGLGSMPETGLQGEVPVNDRNSRRSLQGYRCNLEVLGNAPGEGGSWQHAFYGHCAYYDSSFNSHIGTYVIDVADPAKPKETTRLTSISMQDPWESLSVADNRPDGRKLLGGVFVNAQGGGFFDVYDIKDDCAKPKLLFSGAASGLNHEGNWSMDGMTFYSTGLFGGLVTAINVDTPEQPVPIISWLASPIVHGLSTSDDGNRMYLADISGQDGNGNGLSIWDTSNIQSRTPSAPPTVVGSVGWTDGATAQHTIPITVKGHPYVVFVDEGGMGMARIIDIADETKPKVISKLKLEIDMEANTARRDESGGLSGSFGYNAHYCGIDSRVDPTVLGCSYFASGVRIFDIRDPYHPKEIAYLNVGGTGEASPPGSQEGVQDSTSAYASARVRFIKERGEIWFTDQNKGFFTARFTNGVWPFKEPVATAATADVGLPRPATCLSKKAVSFRVKVPKNRGSARSAVVYLNGRAIKRLNARALRRAVTVSLPAGRHSKVRVVVTTSRKRKFTQTRGYTRCA